MRRFFLHLSLLSNLVLTTSSCIYDTECERFKFVNDSNLDLLLLFDFVTSDDSISEGFWFDSVRGNNYIYIDTEIGDSWDKHVKDSLHLYILRDTMLEQWRNNNPKTSIRVFIEECITDVYINESLIARMTLRLEDVFPTTYPFKEIIFPPSIYKSIYYNTICYNGYDFLLSEFR